MTVFPYSLERLFVDQDRDLVIDSIAAVLAWVPGTIRRKVTKPFVFPLDHAQAGVTAAHSLDLTWDDNALEALDPGVTARADRLRGGRTVQREHVTELAAYGLAFVAVSALMPGRRVTAMMMGAAPDFLFDVTPGALRGVEVAGRESGGRRALLAVRDGTKPTVRNPSGTQGKAQQLLARIDVAEVHLSLWCASARLGIMEQLRP